jgi:hypothetical protein
VYYSRYSRKNAIFNRRKADHMGHDVGGGVWREEGVWGEEIVKGTKRKMEKQL